MIKDFTFKACVDLVTVALPSALTRIGAEAFEGCTSLQSITLPSTLTKIGPLQEHYILEYFRSTQLFTHKPTFAGCTGLTTITIRYTGDRPTDFANAFDPEKRGLIQWVKID